MHAGIPTPPGTRQTPPRIRHPPGPGRHPPGPGRHPPRPGRPPQTREAPPDQTPPPPPRTRQTPPGSRLQHTVYKQPVRILLECILVKIYFPKYRCHKKITKQECIPVRLLTDEGKGVPSRSLILHGTPCIMEPTHPTTPPNRWTEQTSVKTWPTPNFVCVR